MKVLSVTHDHPLMGHSGVSVYCRDVLPAFAQRGIEVGTLSMGPRGFGRPRLHRHQREDMQMYEIQNPTIDPDTSLRYPSHDLDDGPIESLFRTCLTEFRPDIVHLHTLYGYPGSIIAQAKSLGAAVVATLHDYWPLCPRVLLVRADGHSCDGPNGGRNCVEFCVPEDSVRRMVYRFGMRLPEGPLRVAFLAGRQAYKKLFTQRGSSMWEGTAPPASSQRLLMQHSVRAPALLRALQQADAILAVSEFTKTVYARHGVPLERMLTLPLALNIAGIAGAPKRFRRREATYPLALGFLGRATPLKGAHVFAEASRGIPPDRARFAFFGPADAESRAYLQRLAGEHPLEFHGPYTRDRLPQVLERLDVVVVPSVGQETVALTALEAQAAGIPVIASRIGAIPERIRDGENGLLFSPGDAGDLRAKVLQLIDRPELIGEMAARTREVDPFDRHVDRLLRIYDATLEERRGVAWAGSQA